MIVYLDRVGYHLISLVIVIVIKHVFNYHDQMQSNVLGYAVGLVASVVNHKKGIHCFRRIV